MTRKSFKHLFAAVAIALIVSNLMLFSGCEEDTPVIYDFGASSEDFMQAYLTFTHSFLMVDGMLKSMEDSLAEHPDGSYIYDGIQVSVEPADPLSFPKTFTMNLGGFHPDSLFTGIISGSVSSDYVTEGSAVEFTFDDCTINHGRPTANCVVNNMGMVSGKMLFEFAVNDGRLIKYFDTDTAITVLFGGEQDIMWAAGTDVLTIPEALLTGMASDSLSFSAEVNRDYDILKEPDCVYIIDGIFDYAVMNKTGDEVGAGVADFGYVNPQDCDNYVIIVVDGEANRSEYIYLMDWVNPGD